MGLEHSKPLTQMQSEDVAAVVEKLGSNYTGAANAIRENGVDGSFLASLSAAERQETLDDLGVKNRLHRRVLERKLAAAVEEAKDHCVVSWGELEEEPAQQLPGLQRTMSAMSTSSRYTSRSTRTAKSMEQKEVETKKLLDLMTLAAEQQMLERYALMEKESELQRQIQLCSTNQAA